MRQAAVLFVALFSLSIFLSGCASSQMQVRQPFETKLGSYSNFMFYTESAVADDVTEEITWLETEVISRVNELNLFSKTELGKGTGSPSGTLLVKAVIKEINKVSGVERFFLGAFAGNAALVTEITFSDGNTGKTLGVFDLSGESGTSGVSGGTDAAIIEVAQGIADLISQNYK
jgi:hypothetical protein